MKSKVLIFRAMNVESDLSWKINEALAEEENIGWRVVSARTESVLFGEMEANLITVAMHVYLTTTLILEKEGEI